MSARVVAVACAPSHGFSKAAAATISLVANRGVAGDAHHGESVKHRSRVAKDPTQPNLRQVHLLQEELFAELRTKGFIVRPGELGENITTAGIDLLSLSEGTRLTIGADVLIEVTGLRNPCRQIDAFQPGLMHAVLDRDVQGILVRKAGVMGIVIEGGEVRAGDCIVATDPAGEIRPLRPV